MNSSQTPTFVSFILNNFQSEQKSKYTDDLCSSIIAQFEKMGLADALDDLSTQDGASSEGDCTMEELRSRDQFIKELIN